MSSPRVDEEGPVQMETPASAAAGPTVGANYHGGIMADAIGRLKLGADGHWWNRGGMMRRITHTE